MECGVRQGGGHVRHEGEDEAGHVLEKAFKRAAGKPDGWRI